MLVLWLMICAPVQCDSGIDELSDFDAAALLKDWTAAGHRCRSVEAVGIDDDVAPLRASQRPLSLHHQLRKPADPVAEIGDRVLDLLKHHVS
jgi:hypothetical protein